ncbi:MAG: hypothetical protein RLZZ450_2778 [Pseudomonadota bacterium]
MSSSATFHPLCLAYERNMMFIRGERFGLLGSVVVIGSLAAACTDGDGSPTVQNQGAADGSSRMVDASLTPLPALDASGAMLGDGGVPTARFEPLVDNQGWRRYEAALDPLRSHQPGELTCAASATFLEYGSFEIDTTRCNYVLSEHPSQLALARGTELKMELLHYDLTAPEPAEAHVAILFGDALQWETSIPIPSAGDVVKASFTATRSLALGDPIRLHLHNHGGNAYLIVSLQAKQ